MTNQQTNLTKKDALLLKYTANKNQWTQNKNKVARVLGNIVGIPLMLLFLLMAGSIFFSDKIITSDVLGGLFMAFLICFCLGAYFFVNANLKFIIDFDTKSIYYSLLNKKFKVIKGSQLRDVYIIDLTQQTRYKGYQYYINYSDNKNPVAKNKLDVTMQDMIANPNNAPMVKIKRIRITGDYKLRTEIEQVNYIMNQIITQLQS
jgi:hypothetical protein